jgi:hypothetical protein
VDKRIEPLDTLIDKDDYDRINFDYAQWERAKPYPYERIVVSARRRPLLGRITPMGWYCLASLAVAVVVLLWGGL